jgi:hypothetical protein
MGRVCALRVRESPDDRWVSRETEAMRRQAQIAKKRTRGRRIEAADPTLMGLSFPRGRRKKEEKRETD